MLNLVVCIKQVPMVTELPWDRQTGTLRRELAEGMMNPACKHALEGALQLKETHGAFITAICMGPPTASEVLFEAGALGADRCLMLSDARMAGSDTLVTSSVLARAVEIYCPDFDLILCGCHTTDSETAQVGPQLAEELDLPSVAYAEHLALERNILTVRRLSDGFMETLEMQLPGLVTVATQHFVPRYTALGGLQCAFAGHNLLTIGAEDLGLDPHGLGLKGSPTQIINVYQSGTHKENLVLNGSAKKIVEDLLERFEDRLGGAIGKDLKAGEV